MVADVVAIYGALIATIVGYVQLLQWRSSRKFLAVSFIVGIDSKAGDLLEVAISNRGPYPVHLDFVAAGRSCRLWRAPWSRVFDNLRSLSAIKSVRELEETLQGSIDGTTLQPGEIIYGAIRRSDEVFQPQSRLSNWTWGFWYRDCVWIEHSQSDRAICKLIRWPK